MIHKRIHINVLLILSIHSAQTTPKSGEQLEDFDSE